MRPSLFSILLALVTVVVQPPRTSAQTLTSGPDFNLAYELAAASYCAYTVGEIDMNGDKSGDFGQKRAADCLAAAAGMDPVRLDALKVGSAEVEAYFDAAKPQNAYLLIHAKNGIILAFRGTLTPPISPQNARRDGLFSEAIKIHNANVRDGLITFFRDWLSNINAGADALDRHKGFDEAWRGLKDHLKTECGPAPGSTKACSKFQSFMRAAPQPQLFFTGHSKGGALATLAALDVQEIVEQAPKPTVYVFAAAKSLSSKGAKNAPATTHDIWRFEYEGDVVPSLPSDETVLRFATPYSHVGRRVLFSKGAKPDISSRSTDGVDPPGDWTRLMAILNGGTPTGAATEGSLLPDLILRIGAAECRKFVDTHFAVFSSVQNIAVAPADGQALQPSGDRKDPGGDFFFSGVSNSQGQILWGYGQWCSLLDPGK
jgi:hypothetical protein